MRATFITAMVCATFAFWAFLKYFAGPVTLAKGQQEFALNMIMLGAARMLHPSPAPQPKIAYAGQPVAPPSVPSPNPDEPFDWFK